MTDSKLSRAYNYLKQQISTGRFVPGYRLVLGSIARDLDMSVVPVREAIRLLEAEGLVTFEHNVGAQVALINADEYISTYNALTVVESAAIALAAEYLTTGDLLRAREINERMRRGVHDLFDAHGFTQLNAEFHRVLYSVCPNEDLLDFVNRCWSRIAGLRDSVFSFVPERAPHSVTDHDRILDLIESRASAEEIEQAVRAHRAGTIGALTEYQSSHQHSDRTSRLAQ